MNQEHFGLIVGLATIGAFLLELARKGEKDTPINK